MARFYGRFDSGSANAQDTWVTSLDNDYFERRRIGADSGSGARLRNGLISSRSLLSTDALGDVADTYRDGKQGTIVPVDLYTTNGSTYVSWSKAGGGVYTSPSSTGWGVVTPSSYRTRPTGSILSTNALLTQQNYQVGVSYATYTNATTAVRDVLDAVQTATPTNTTPFTRPGNNSSRTYHSIWHDENLQYFAWDDFTPGEMSSTGMDVSFAGADCNQTPSPGAVSTLQFTWNNVTSYTYKNDGNASGRIGVELEVSKATGASGTCDTNWNVPRFRLQLGYSANTHGGPLTLGTSTSGNGPTNPSTKTSPGNCTGTSTWTWNGFGGYAAGGTPNLTWTVKLEDCISPGYDITVSTKLYDATITDSTNAGTPGIFTKQGSVPNTA